MNLSQNWIWSLLRVCAGRWTGCWKKLLAQPRMECHLVRTLYQTWTLSTMSPFLPSHFNSFYLHSRQWQQTWTEDASLGLEVNWQKTKVQALESRQEEPPTTTVKWQEVAVEECVYLGSAIYLTTQISPEISRRNAITGATMRYLDSQIWKSRITIYSKLNQSCIILALSIFLHSSECWAVTRRDEHKADALWSMVSA